MRKSSWLRGVRDAVLFGSVCMRCALASPAVNVALQASFPSPPFLVELLETAAEENATSYFPLLDRVAEGAFKHVWSDEQLYNRFLKILQEDGHLTDPQALSSFKLAVSVRAAAPRVEAQYQFYRTSVEPSLSKREEAECDTKAWVDFNGRQYCTAYLRGDGHELHKSYSQELPFDRVLGDPRNKLPAILYADVSSEEFARFHYTLKETARDGKTSYRLRHIPPTSAANSALPVNGYGVALDLKRTDYIVIDDRQAEEQDTKDSAQPAGLELDKEGEVTDVKPLSSSELLRLGLRASSFVMQSEDPLDTLVKLTQDFPKHSSAVSAFNVSQEFQDEHRANREQLLRPGFTVMWMNGVQMDPRKIDAFSLLDHMRRERDLINAGKTLGLSGREVINLLSHSAITEAQTDEEPARYDWRDELNGGKVIIWMNDLEKDKRYEDWPTALAALLQRTYPGQMQSVRRDIHNVIIPIDFSNPADVETVVETLHSFVKRKLPLRFGIVPMATTAAAAEQAKVVYHLLDAYGLSALITYLEASAVKGQLAEPHSAIFDNVIKIRKIRKDKAAQKLQDVLASEDSSALVEASKAYLKRLGASGASPPVFVNGAAVPKNDEWLQSMSRRLTTDLRTIQQNIFEDAFEENHWLPGFFLLQASPNRNPLIVPEDEKTIKLVDMARIYSDHLDLLNLLHYMPAASDSDKDGWTQLFIVDNFDYWIAEQRLHGLIKFKKENPHVEVIFVHNQHWGAAVNAPGAKLSGADPDGLGQAWTTEDLAAILDIDLRLASIRRVAPETWDKTVALIDAFGLKEGESGIILNGRVVPLGSIDEAIPFEKSDFDALLAYEQKKRIAPAIKAVQGLGLQERISGLGKAAVSSLIAISAVSDIPEGIFEALPTTRTDMFGSWKAERTAIVKGDIETATLQIVVSLDPASEIAQRWVPILKVLSDFANVHLRLFLNPKDRLEELPVKRFYRYVLDSHPKFNDGALRSLQAEFTGLPSETLLTMAMDVPPPWLVAPKDSIYDLDNIKLSSIKDRESVDAVYELESILIEGHSRDLTTGVLPRGTKLELGTGSNPHFADTMIMANLGYFQFKANPGFYKIELQDGRSKEIFTIDSIGAMGWNTVPGDESTDVALTSFQGLTLYPRLSRKPGKESADVLQPASASTEDVVAKGAAAVDNVLAKVGLGSVKSGKYLSQGLKLGSGMLGLKSDAKPGTQADINIFSVASGHLYERMLNIMMVSVMRHTNHTVKFWFIEQFLSPSFKSFLPTVAKEYGFDYEMVTYKWPHWLRGQKEKQREIWGYKILFLDVLFPLDIDKVIFVDADQIVRTDMIELVNHDLQGAPYGFTPMCDSRTEMEGFRFWKQGYWKNFLRGSPYHISALYVVDLKRFRQIAAGDRLRQQYHQLSADPNSLSNLDQDLPNNMQMSIPIHSLPQNWLWCETWCSDESLKDAKTIDLCNNPQTKEPKLDRARRQVPEWTEYDDEIAALARRTKSDIHPEGIVKEPDETSAPVVHDGQSDTPGHDSKAHIIDEL